MTVVMRGLVAVYEATEAQLSPLINIVHCRSRLELHFSLILCKVYTNCTLVTSRMQLS